MKQTKLDKLFNEVKHLDKSKLTLVKRKKKTGKWFYIKNYNVTPVKWISLGTTDELRVAKIFADATSNIEFVDSELALEVRLRIAKMDPKNAERTWQDVHEAVISQGQKETTIKATG